MIVMQGKGVSAGVMKGPLYLFRRQDTAVMKNHVEDTQWESDRLRFKFPKTGGALHSCE